MDDLLAEFIAESREMLDALGVLGAAFVIGRHQVGMHEHEDAKALHVTMS